MTNHLIMPIVGAIFGGLNFDNYFLPLSSTVTATNLADAQKQGAVLAYGAFLTVLINFLIVAWMLFMLVKAANTFRSRDPPTPTAPTTTEALLMEIRDALVARK